MKRGEAKIGQRVCVPGWLFGCCGYDTVPAVVTRDLSTWRGQVNVVEVEYQGERKRVNVCYLEPAP